MNILAYAFPVFLILVALEAFSLRANMTCKYRLNETLSNLSCGVFDQVVNAFIGTLFIGVFALTQAKFGYFTFSLTSVIDWLILIVAIDFTYYVFHRASHRSNFLWATHVVHHHSEQYNLTVSLRQGTIATWVTYMFYLPLSFVGFPAIMFLTVHGVYQLYQFIVHTHYLKSLGPLEKIIASPRLHRVHHGQNTRYWDKNYGGLFIIWDKLFNSFQKPSVKIKYGITTGMKSWDPFWANLYYFKYIRSSLKKADSWKEKMKLVFGPPGLSKIEPAHYPYGYNSKIQKGWRLYGVTQLAVSIIGAFLLVLFIDTVSFATALAAAFIILLAISNVNGLFDGRKVAIRIEQIKFGIGIIAVVVLFILGARSFVLYIAALVLLASLAWFVVTQSRHPYIVRKRA